VSKTSYLSRSVWLGLAIAALGGCNGPAEADRYAGFQNEDPAVRNQAIHQAGQAKDRQALPFLVDRLTDSQEDVRLFAFIALRRITGKTMGWRHYEPPQKRAEAVARWRVWLASGRKDATTTSQEAKSK